MDNQSSPTAPATQMTPPTEEELFQILSDNYECLRRYCRLGKFEHTVASVGQSYVTEGASFHSLRPDSAAGKSIPFIEAVENCYQLFRYLSRKPSARQHGTLLLRVKIVIYEAKDYWLSVPKELAADVVKEAKEFDPSLLTEEAEKLRGGPFPSIDDRTRVVKDLVIAALFGANQLYRQHNASSYEMARKILTDICCYIDTELPMQHGERRASYGLEGMAHYLRGRILSAQGSFNDARKEFRRSADAYIARLRQKENFLSLSKISKAEFEEKRTVTVRRLALVSAFGDGHISFIKSRITRALEILTLARAVLADSGRLYLLYVDVLYWSCRRAIDSSDQTRLDSIIECMTVCWAEICSRAAGSHYAHRSGLELALTLYYRSQLAYDNRDHEKGDHLYERGIELLNSAVKFGTEHNNPHIHADALIIRSHFFRLSFSLKRTRASSADDETPILQQALQDAEQAVGLSANLPALASDAFIARGAVETTFAELYGKDEEFRRHYDRARSSFNNALNRNTDENLRVQAEAHLRLAKLSLLDPHSEFFAYSHFKRWEEVKDRVEHEYCHEMARKISSQIQQEGPILILRAGDILNHKDLEKVIKKFSVDAALFELITQHAGKSHVYANGEWHDLLRDVLMSKLGYRKTHALKLIKDLKLIDRIKELRGPLP